MTGVILDESWNIVSRLNGSGCVYSLLSLFSTNCVAMNSTRSDRIVLMMIILRRWSHFWSHSPGSASVSGVELIYQRFHSFALCVKAPMMPVKLAILSRSQTTSQLAYWIQSGLGLGGWFLRSAVRSAPLRKKFHSSASISVLRRTAIMMDNKSLSYSKSPRHA